MSADNHIGKRLIGLGAIGAVLYITLVLHPDRNVNSVPTSGEPNPDNAKPTETTAALPSQADINQRLFDQRVALLEVSLPNGFVSANGLTKDVTLGHLDGTSERVTVDLKPEVVKIKNADGSVDPVVAYPVQDKKGNWFLYIGDNKLVPPGSMPDSQTKSHFVWDPSYIKVISQPSADNDDLSAQPTSQDNPELVIGAILAGLITVTGLGTLKLVNKIRERKIAYEVALMQNAMAFYREQAARVKIKREKVRPRTLVLSDQPTTESFRKAYTPMAALMMVLKSLANIEDLNVWMREGWVFSHRSSNESVAEDGFTSATTGRHYTPEELAQMYYTGKKLKFNNPWQAIRHAFGRTLDYDAEKVSEAMAAYSRGDTSITLEQLKKRPPREPFEEMEKVNEKMLRRLRKKYGSGFTGLPKEEAGSSQNTETNIKAAIRAIRKK